MNVVETINFHGDDLLVVLEDGKPHVVLKRAFELIGLDADRQIANVQERHWACTAVTAVQLPGETQRRNVVVADIRTFLMHLATIPLSRVAEHVRPKLADYQREVADVIEAHFTGNREKVFQPTTVTWTELAALIRQRYGIPLEVVDITRALRDGGVLMQDCCKPKKAYRQWFWFTGSAWTIHPHVLPELTRKLVDTRRSLGDIQSQLQLDLALDEQLRREIGGKGGAS
ncbi:phage antirepressor N-terminal domain-containing protein [Nocardia sp. CC227C]|uniref:phage antirepressor N-terminal domain-containing protein n=1 Tax=Nocardia sp. CC227C TaxID=3044562 RepID=UPI00278C3281|nr:phage antirepressor N-terminal domain-containing protein [Nocardia sp. CC227C]